MTVHNVSKNWKYFMYDCSDSRWYSDYITISDNQKKMCSKEWNKLAKSMDVRLKISFFPPEISLGGNYDVR